MKEKAADTEDHHTKVELDHQPKSLNSQPNINKKPSSITAITTTTISTSSSSSSSSSSFISPNSIVPLTSSSSASKVSIPAKNPKPSSPSSSSIPSSPSSSKTPLLSPSSNNNNNFDDDYNEWDISIGDLIIDLDADIEREGDKQQNNRNAVAVVDNTKINNNNNNDSSNNNTNNNNNKNNHNRKDNNNNNTRNDSTATINTASLNSTQQANSIIKNNINNNNNKINSKKTETSATSLSGMSSNFKLNRLGPLASSGTSNSEKSATVSNNISNNNTNNNNNSNNSCSSNNNPHGSQSAVLSLKPNSPGASTTIAATIASTSAPISSSAASNSNNINNSGLSSTNGSTTSSNNTLNRHSHGGGGGVAGGGVGNNNKSNFALSSSSTTGLNVSSSAGNISNASPSTATTTSKNLNPSLIENHHAKGLKMKIKRKNVGGKTSEINHEIVSSDASPQNCRNSYISSIDQNNSGSTNLNLTNTTNPATNSAKNIPAHIASNSKAAAAAATTTAVLVIDSTDTVINSVADPEEVVIKSINQDSGSFGSTSAVATSKSIAAAKHSNKNKNGHRDKKDKTRIDKVKILPSATIGTFPSTNHPVQTTTVSENDEIVSSSSVAAAAAAAGAANVNAPMIKYPNSTVINLKPEDAANNSSNNPNPVNSFNKQRNKPEKLDDHISDQIDVGTMTSIATITEPDCLGPCEPGTSVTLEGIVWQETENGVLVVNVTWRGKTYVGTLLDCTKHDWAPPRFCESPTSDIESKSLKNTRGKRSRNNFITENSIDTRSVTSKLRNGKGRRTANSGYLPTSPAKGDSVVNLNANNKRKGRPNELELNVTEDNAKRTKLSKIDVCSDNATSGNNNNNNNNGGVIVIGGGNGGGSGCVGGGGGSGGSNVGVSQQPNSPVLIECPEPNCSKKYRHINGLKYHQSHAHFGSTFNVLSDSQEFENTSTNETLNSNKGDVSDSDNNDSNALDSPLKIVDKLTNLDMIVKATTQTKSTTQTSLSSSTTSLSLAVDESSGSNENEQQQNTTVAIDSVKKFLKNGCEPLDSNELGSDENYKPSFLSSSSSSSTHVKASFEDKNLISSDSELTGGDANLDLIAKSDLKHATENNSTSERKTNSNDVVNHQTENLKIPGGDCEIDNVPSPAYSDISDDNSTNNDNSHASGGSNSNSGGSNNTMANTSSTAGTAAINMNSNKMNESFLESMKKMPNMNDFNLSALPHYLNKSSFLFPNHHHPTNDPKVNDLKLSESSSSLTDEMMENLEHQHQHQQQSRPPPQGPYPSYPLFRYGSSSSASASDFKPSAPPPPPLPPTSMIRMNESIDSNRNENDSKDNVSRIKDDNNSDYGSGSSSSGGGGGGGGGGLNPKQPIVELQNLKNRISYSFDQNPGMYEMPKLKFPQQPPQQPQQHSLPPPSMMMGENEREREREREKPLKDRSKYSPQTKKSSKDKEHNNDNKEKNKHHHHQQQQQQQSHDEGMKPTMESTGPPTLSNGYYYNPSFLPPSFSFDSIFRGNALMGSPYGPPPQGPPPSASSFLHSQMRFPHMNMNLDGLAMSNAPNVSRTSTATSQPQQHSSINTSKNLGHSSSSSSSSLSYNHNNSKLLSPTSSSVCVPSSSASSLSSSHSALPPNFKSPSKEYPNHSMPMPQDHHLHHAQQQHLHPQHQQHRPSMNASNSTMHPPPPPPPRHSLHTSAIGYPIFDPYSAMIVNHAVNQANSVHPFAPK